MDGSFVWYVAGGVAFSAAMCIWAFAVLPRRIAQTAAGR